jgi:hypothetical protein
MRHSSGSGWSLETEFRKPEKWVHFAGESKTLGYSIGLMSTIFRSWAIMSIFDWQWGQA